ncbi:hypothetical protein [Methylobacterium tardum]|uniref:hypothetical protein n=1 Tax=Methylobacterium tardum TaxID=374432 RepID=UPI001EE03732|nr:hypothetical protein [Methylobacterium tardum]URD38151.1 hypothetical protein M6G65_06715 [Methylobacterium tardum]
MLAASKITAAQRDRWCLVPEARHADLLRLVRIDVSTRDKRGRAMRATGLSNAAVAARATLDELQPVIAFQENFAERMRRMILSEIAQYAAWEAGAPEAVGAVPGWREQDAIRKRFARTGIRPVSA